MSYRRTETEIEMKHKTDSELMQAYQSGNVKAFEMLYSRYRTRLYVYAYSLLKRVHEAEEAMHEVFTRLIENTQAFSKADSLSSFLFAVCRNFCINAAKKNNRLTTGLEPAAFQLLRQGNPNCRAAMREEAAHLNTVIGALPSKQREVLVLKVYSGLTFSQIAEATGQPRGTVATRYRSAIESVRQALQVQGR